MFRKVYLLVLVITMLCIIKAAPAKTTHKEAPLTAVQQHPIAEMQLLHPHIITLERFESLLRRAGEIFRPSSFQLTPAAEYGAIAQPQQIQQVAVPYQQMQPPTEEPYTYYFPLFEQDNAKLDAKSLSMVDIAPPPAPSKKQHGQQNYYAAKPKKMPKKFNADVKQVNMKWLNAFEKEALADAVGDIPKAVYLVNDERNRINFDDSFFAVDMHVKTPDNQPHKESAKYNDEQSDEFASQGEEDLLAAAAVQVPLVNLHYRTLKKA